MPSGSVPRGQDAHFLLLRKDLCGWGLRSRMFVRYPFVMAVTHTKQPKGAVKVPRKYAHSNDAVKTAKSLDDLPRLDHLRGRNIVTVDLDGTLYDPWAAVGHRGNFGTDPETGNTCVRQDTLDWVAARCAEHDAVPVILSWRAGLVDISARWLAEIGFDYAALFIPGSNDDVSGVALPKMQRKAWGGGQVQFKIATLVTLLAAYDVTIVGATDDNLDVCDAIATKLGLGDDVVRQAPRLVEVADHEWRAGYIGAPKPKYTPWAASTGKRDLYNDEPAFATSPGQRSLWDAYSDAGGTIDDFDDDDFDALCDGLAEWGLGLGDRVRCDMYGIDGAVGEIIDFVDGVVLFTDEIDGCDYEADPEDLEIDDHGTWIQVQQIARPAPSHRPVTAAPTSGLRAGDPVEWTETHTGTLVSVKEREAIIYTAGGNMATVPLAKVRYDLAAAPF